MLEGDHTHDEATNECSTLQNSSILPIIESKAENDALTSHFGLEFWVNMQRDSKNVSYFNVFSKKFYIQRQKFVYSNGKPVEYSNFRKNEPNDVDKNENYVVLSRAEGMWNDVSTNE